jgi:hypothetical protein
MPPRFATPVKRKQEDSREHESEPQGDSQGKDHIQDERIGHRCPQTRENSAGKKQQAGTGAL